MSCQSRCEIQVQASRRRLSGTFSRPSTRRSLAVWGWACRSAVRSSKRITDDCGRARTCPAAPAFNSPCQRSQTLRRDAALAGRPKGQATRPRVLLWVKMRNTQKEQINFRAAALNGSSPARAPCRKSADSVAKVVLLKVSKILRVAGAFFV